MVAVVRPSGWPTVEAVCARWELAVHGDRRGHATGELRAFCDGRRRRRRSRRDLLTERGARATRSSRSRGPGASGVRACRSAHRGAQRPERPTRRGSTEQLRPARRLAHGAPSGPGRGRAAAPAVVRGLAVSLDGPPAGERDPFRAGCRRGARGGAQRRLRRRASRSRSRTASTSATPRARDRAGSWPRRSRAWRSAAEALGIPVVSGNVSLYNETDGRPIPPTPVVGLRRARRDVTPRAARAGARATSCWLAQAAGDDLDAEAALVDGDMAGRTRTERWRTTCPRADWRSRSPRWRWPAGRASSSRATCPSSTVAARIVVAGPREARNRFSLGLRELGVVAGDSVLGTPLAELRAAWGEL